MSRITDKTPTIVFEPPDEDAPGFLRTQKRALTIGRELQSAIPNPDVVDEVIEFLLPYVTEPEDKEQAREALWDCSRRQWLDMMNAIQGKEMSNEVAIETIPKA